jgi:hypothetical protein
LILWGEILLLNGLNVTSKNPNPVIPAEAGIQRLYEKCSYVSALHCVNIFAGHRPSPV